MVLCLRHPPSLQRVPVAPVPRLPRYYEGATTSCPRVSFGLLFRQPVPQVPVGFVRRFHAPDAGTGTAPGQEFWSAAPPRACGTLPADRGRISQVPWRAIPRLCIGLRPRTVRRASPWRRFRCCPHYLKNEGTDVEDIEAQLRCFAAHCVRFTTPVAVRHATLVPGWRAAPLPDGSRTRWLASKGFYLIVISSFPELLLALSDFLTSNSRECHVFAPAKWGSAIFPGSS